ncbi:MAG: polymerase PolC-type [Pseudomonadota bacterium]
MATASSPDQIGFDFGAAFVAPETPRKVAPKRHTHHSTVAPIPSPSCTPVNDLEQAAKALEESGQYRILRRLPVINHYPPCSPSDPSFRVAVVDTETTGLDPARERIIELSMLIVNINLVTGQPCGDVTCCGGLEDPKKPIPPEVIQLTGIDDAMVTGQHIDDVSVESALQEVDVVVAHNAGFDRKFMEQRWPAFAELAWGCSVQDIPWKQLGHGSVKLEFLAHEMGWFYDAHRAEIDCRAVLSLLSQPFKRTTAESPLQSQTGWQLLWQSVQQPTLRVQATGSPFESKDVLRQAGYRWDAEERVWYRFIAAPLMAQEALWLQESVYKGRDATLAIETLDATRRYSNRRGQTDYESLSRWTEA